jgi:phosphomannomutase/phosphoglucomutase
LFVAGVLMLFLGLMLKIRPYKPPVELEEDPVQIEQDNRAGEESDQAADIEEQSMKPAGIDAGDGLGVIDLPDLGFTLEQPNMPHIKAAPPVELVESIFRAYDIRGIVGETLDADVARQVGQVVGSLTLEQEAGPVIVARDGRDSGPDLVDGMIEGISSTGCDVVDIGAVPTGVLYFAAYELGNGTGVMITGSHNPSNYNGFKILIGGVTQAGDQITDMFNRIQSGNLRVGKGQVSREDVLDQFRERISGDIQLKRPLKVVADCGNGIGGICAADVLRDIGAEVIPLFDEVDGSFPNHHPDPSEPENLKDLIESVQLMEADIGIAFDGDADRLGVVTADGEIIYSDRLMMLFVKDVLGRVPGSTIIYDVKCTGHLHDVIEQAGGKAMMYKTGHSLIKNKMRDVDSPFAGEMSGHFFFKERWYGFDCGIYSAARLLEILAADELSPSDVLSGLPSSVSTPELKVKMEEGENHAFVVELQDKARFENAKINTIDGVRADFSDGWGLVRASNTTPILVCRFDADNEEALQRIKDDFKKQMLAINEDLDLPF